MYTTIVHENGIVEGKPITAKEIKGEDGEIMFEDSLLIGDTIFFEKTQRVVKKTGQGFFVERTYEEGVVFKDGLFQDTTLFQPTIEHNEEKAKEPKPKYNKSWEVYDGNGKTKKLIYIDFPEYYVKYWKEQKKRVREGYEVQGIKISGFFYFYLNFWRIRSKKLGGGFIPPRFLDLDFDFFKSVEICIEKNKNLIILKRRQMGFSEKLAAIAAYYMLMYPACQVLIIAGEKKYSYDTYTKMITGIERLDRKSANGGEAFYKRFISKTESNNVPKCKIGYVVDGVEKGFLTEAYCITTNKSAQAMAGKNAAFMALEEYGLMPDSNLVLEYGRETMKEGGVMGQGKLIVAGGTGGEMGSGIEFMQTQFYNPIAYDFQGFKNENGKITGKFYGAQWYYVTDKSGNSYAYESEFIVKEMRKALKGASLLTYITQMPLTPEEAFMSSDSTPFFSKQLQSINDVLNRNAKNIKEIRARYDWVYENGIPIGVKQTTGPETAVDNEGDLQYPFIITEECRHIGGNRETVLLSDYKNTYTIGHTKEAVVLHKNLYFAGTDSYDQDVALTSKSEGAFAIHKGYLNEQDTSFHFPCFLLWRPSRKEKFYEQTMLASIYWGCTNLIEHSKIMIYNTYYYANMTNLLENKPSLLYQNKESDTSNKWGVDASTKGSWEIYFKMYLETFCLNLQHPMLSNTFLKYESTKNSDLTIACMLARINYLTNNTSVAKKNVSIKKENKVALMGYVRNNAGSFSSINRLN